MKKENSSAVYVPTTEAKTLSYKIVHFLMFCNEHRPGERISLQEITREVFQIQRATKSNVKQIKKHVSALPGIINRDHSFGCDTNKDGVKVLTNSTEIIEKALIPSVKELKSKQRKTKKNIDIVYAQGGPDKCEKKLQEFFRATEKQLSRLALPDVEEIEKRLLTK